MTILHRNQSYVEGVKTGGGDDREERNLPLPSNIYSALSGRRSEISAASTAHILWDDETCSMLLIGSRETVEETALILSQFVSGNKKLSRTETDRQTDRQTAIEAKNLLLMSQLPPELTISNRSPGQDGVYSQFSGIQLGENLNRMDSTDQTTVFPRRKLETEDSSYDSDHEHGGPPTSTSSVETVLPATTTEGHKVTSAVDPVAHEDVERSFSETLGQEFAEYVTVKHRGSAGSRDSSPTLSERLDCLRDSPGPNERLECVQEDPGDNEDIHSITQNPKYNAKVEFALKLGYPESLTQKALLKVGMFAQQNELLDELIRLQQIKCVDPKELLLKEAHELLSSTLPAQIIDPPRLVESKSADNSSNLRPIVIDGSNVAMSHGNKEKFSCLGIQICVNWFQKRGHKDITVFVPKWRKESSKPESPTTAQHILTQLEKERLLIFTPSRQVGGRRVVCLDDRFILNLAAETDAVVVSNDNFRELINEKPEFRKVIEERVLMFSFVNDRFMPPDDPLGRNGPTLDNFLRKTPTLTDLPQPCPYGKKCTYGNKCKFYHAERGTVPHKSVTDRLKEQSIRKIMEVRTRNTSRDSSPGELARAKSINLLLQRTESDSTGFNRPKQSVARTLSSRPAISRNEDLYPDSLLIKADIAKSKSSDITGGRYRQNMRMSSAPNTDWTGNLELGCLNNYGLGGLIHSAPPPPGPWNTLVPPPPPSAADGNSHRRLERQLTINPAFDPRINKPRFPKTSDILSSAAMEYMHRNPPPPLGVAPVDHAEFPHQNVTRIASAPDSIRQWGSTAGGGTIGSPPVAVVEPLGLGVNTKHLANSPLQRSNSTSDTQLNKEAYTDSASSWKFESGISPILGGTAGQGSSIWGPLPTASPSLDTPPPSPGVSNLGPVGSRPPPRASESRLELQYHLSALFPQDQVEKVLALMPDEQDPKTLCAAIMKMFPPA